MKKSELLQDSDFTQEYAIVLDGELYKSLPPGKNDHLVEFMNEHFGQRPVDKNLVAQYFNSNGCKVPEKNFRSILEVMADALRDTAEVMIQGMSVKAIRLEKQARKSRGRLLTTTRKLKEDVENRRIKEVQV